MKLVMVDAMAASSGGVEWSSIIKPILSASYGSVNKHDVLELCSAINKSESEILHHKDNYKVFYNSFAILAADYISTNASSLSINQMDVVCNACRILLRYLVSALQSLTAEPVPNTVQANRLLSAIRSLCLGTGLLSKSDQTSLTSTMKSENLPPHIKTNPAGSDKESPSKSEPAKPRSDLSTSIFEQLTLPLRDGQCLNDNEPDLSKLAGPSNAEQGTSSAEVCSEIKKLFLSTNTENLQALRASDILLDLCLNLNSIKRSKIKCDEALAGKQFTLPNTHTEATAIRNSLPSIVADISVVYWAISLPVLEPLNPSKLEKLCSLSMACLHCAVTQAAASSVLGMGSAVSPKTTSTQNPANTLTTSKDDDYDTLAVTVVEKALDMFTYVGDTIKNSTRAGGHVYQNLLLAGAWVLLNGLQTQLSVTNASSTAEKDKVSREGRSPSKSRDTNSARISLMKVQQGFGVLSVALATRALILMSDLLDDLHLEICGGAVVPTQIEQAPLTIMGQFSALQRAVRLLGTVPLNQLLFYLATITYRKACTLKRIQKHPPEGDTFSQSDSTTYYEDMIMCSDESSTDDDDDSEPILGQWFEETLAPPETSESNTNGNSNENQDTKATTTERGQSLVPEKGEPHGYITLATQIFAFMNKHFLTTKCGYVTRYVKNGLTEQQMIILAAIIRDLDRETARTETGTISVYFGSALGQLYSEFSSALTRYTHNLVTHNALNSLHTSLLTHLGIFPWNVDVPHAWPLQVYPRTLAVLAQVLLLRPQQEKEASVISIWRRLVNTLVENVINPPSFLDPEGEDLNVEHAQVLLYLFHSLNLMQKKSVLLLTAGGVVRGSEVARGPLKDSQLLHLSRLLLLLDYIMKHLYDAPATLLEQIQWNLFYSTNLTSDKENKEKNVSRMFTSWLDIEENYRKHGGADEFAMKPRFYAITSMDINNQDTPKLDGLACNFILGTPDKLRYPLLLDALIEILNVTHVTAGSAATKLTYLGLCATQYCFTICWRLLQTLPPSTPYMDRLSSGESIPAGPLLLHSLVWGPRAAHKTFSRWLKDCLVKQGMYTQYTEKLLKSVSDSVNTLKYDAGTAKNCIIALTPDVKKGTPVTKENLPPLWHLFLLDAVMAKVQVSLIDEVELNTTTDASGVVVNGATLVQELLPHMLRLAQAILHCSRWSLMHTMTDQSESSTSKYSPQDCDVVLLQDLLAVCSAHNTLTNSLVPDLTALLPSTVCSVLETWNTVFLDDCSWTPYLNDIIPAESYILSIVNAHVSTLSMNATFTINLSLKRLLQCLVKFICQHAPKTENTETKNRAIELLVVLTLDARTEFLHENVQKTLDKMIGDNETDEHQKRVYLFVIEHTYKLIMNYTSSVTPNLTISIDEKILHTCLKFWEKILEKSSGRQAFEAFFTGDNDLVKVLMSVSGQQMSQQYSTRVLHFFNKLFQAAEKSPADPSLNYLCSSISKLANVDGEKLQLWLRHVILGSGNMISSTSSSNIQTPTIAPNSKLPAVEENAKEEPKPTANGTSQWSVTQPASSESNASPSPCDDQKSLLQENSQLLQALTTYIVKQNSNVCEEVAVTILKALIPMGSPILSTPIEGVGFSELMVVMATLADAGSGKGHQYLFTASTEWLEMCRQYLTQKEVLNKINTGCFVGKHSAMLDATSHLLNYFEDIVNALQPQTNGSNSGTSLSRALSPPWEGEIPPEFDSEWPDEVNEEEDSAAEDSDEDSLCNKLCTFTVTQKEFMNQHWYHCHTCRMLDGVGVCSVCARVCHRGHDLSYAKYGNFFCDCGAKEDGSCQALVKRSPQTVSEPQPSTSTATNSSSSFGIEPMLTSSLRRRPSSPILLEKSHNFKDKKKNSSVVKQIESSRDWLLNQISESPMVANLLEILNNLIPAVETSCERNSPVGCHARAQQALQALHTGEKKFVHTDQLMLPTLGSQEGAFENVRMSYAGEQGQTIRQLLSAHIVRRVAMCCLSSTHGKRQHLGELIVDFITVSHEKGKITVLQLSALLKQADSSKRKLTLTRLSSAPIPFTVLSLSGNPCNEDFLAVCGLKDCHVLTFSSTGSVADHLVLHPHLETGNFIIRAIWLPGSQTQLALITADFVKIYDLAKDALSPQYFFLVPSGKIRDCTFIYEDGVYNILLMSSPGHIYTETLNEESSAKLGTFYVTNTLEVFHIDVTDVNGQVAGGGVSIYYSHTLGMLFFSYAQGKSFIAPLNSKSNCLTTVYQITLSSATSGSNSKSNGSKTPAPQPLCQWTEIANHPGIVCSVMQTSNNPVILMMKPDSIVVQEIKVIPAKAKIMDMVAIRHITGPELRTTLILLCEDGSLRIYMANMDQTGFWMSPSIQPSNPTTSTKLVRKKKVVKPGKSSNAVTFPVDFFEHCQPMNDVEIGGNDLLQVYNIAQLKHRLNTTGMYVVCTKPLGFTVDVTNSDNNMVMTGIRVLLGNQDVQRAPSYIEVFGRSITTSITRNRWYDIPLTREESLQADKKLTIIFGPSQDPETVTMVDSIKIYGKTKDAFGWPEETEDVLSSTTTQQQQNTTQNPDHDSNSNNPAPLTSLDRLISGLLEVLDGSFCLFQNSEDKLAAHKPAAMDVATKLLCLPTPTNVQMYTKALLSALHPSRLQYHNYKDQALLMHVLESLTQMRDQQNKEQIEIDAESFYRLVLIVRGVAVARPHNLAKFADTHTTLQNVTLDDPLVDLKPDKTQQTTYDKNQHLIYQLMEVLWLLHSLNPEKPALAPVVVPGLKHTEQLVHALVEIIHAFNTCDTENTTMLGLYLQLLLSDDNAISYTVRHAICRVLKPRGRRRRVFIPSPPHCVTPPEKNTESEEEKPTVSNHSSQEEDTRENEQRYDVDPVEAIAFLQDRNIPGGQPGNVNPLEALLGGGAGFPPLLDIPPDADDETMVELAIALSLQEHELSGELQNLQHGLAGAGQPIAVAGAIAGQALQSLQQVLANQGLVQPVGGGSAGPSNQNQEPSGGGHYSDTTASAAGSDDEGSTAATDGSTLRTSPAEQQGGSAGSGGSESGGSGVDSITGEHNVSGRSSSYGDNMQEAISLVGRTESNATTTAFPPAETDIVPEAEEMESEIENSNKLHTLRLHLLDKLINYLPKLKNVDGTRAIPFMQLVIVLTSDLDANNDKDRVCLDNLLTAIIDELRMSNPDTENICTRTKEREVHLIIMRMLSVLMSRYKGSSNNKPSVVDNSTYISQATAAALQNSNVIDFCLTLLQALLDYWKHLANDENNPPIGGALLKEHLPNSPPDMQPFFLKQYVKETLFSGHATDVFESYPQLLTEIALRLPYQVHKHAVLPEPVSDSFDETWYKHLCEYMMTSQTPFVRRQVRKLLLFICGNKEKYRQLRDLHALETHMKAIKQSCTKGGYDSSLSIQHGLSLPYDSLVELMEHLKACLEVAGGRTGNWQRFCIQNPTTLSFLLQVSCLLDEGVAPTVLQLLQSAVCANTTSTNPKKSETSSKSSQSSSRKERERSDESEADSKFEENNCITLVDQLNKQVVPEVLACFIKAFLLETNATTVRWQAHALVLAIYKYGLMLDTLVSLDTSAGHSKSGQQENLLKLLWRLWPHLPAYGNKAAQFVDLLGYFSLRYSETAECAIQVNEYIEQAVGVLRAQNDLLAHHPNANLYAHMAQFVELDGYYLESEPCLVCNNPEVPLSTIKLSAIKVDSKFTTTTQIVKLVGSHTISKITLRIGDLKRTKMVRTINIYYNNRSVQAVVELKNKPALWHKAKKVTLQSGQTEVKIDFPLAIVACNLMIEYADFYENIQASSETLQCPRCSAAVPANPGVCANCGENVFQCHKCRAINYDEKDPFLCHACGFCKYAKFDYTLLARPCCAVESIENDDDRKKMVASINSLLEKADRVYKQLMGNKPSLEALLLKISEHRMDRKAEEGPTNVTTTTAAATAAGGGVQVNKTIQMLAQQYCSECKTSFEELSKIIQKVLVSRKELVAYDRKQNESIPMKSSCIGLAAMSTHPDKPLQARPLSSGRCYGCASAATEHCLTLLRALATNASTRQLLCAQGLIQELVWNNLRKGTVQMQEEVRQLLCVLTRDNCSATTKLCNILIERIEPSLTGMHSYDLGTGVRHEIALLAALVKKEDRCWEQKLRCMMTLFLRACEDSRNPLIMDSIILPCLKIFKGIVRPPTPPNKKNKDKLLSSMCTIKEIDGLNVDVMKWLNKDNVHLFKSWKDRQKSAEDETSSIESAKENLRTYYLAEKYGYRWLTKMNITKETYPFDFKLHSNAWIKTVLFNPSSRFARHVVCNIVESWCCTFERKKKVLTLLTSYLDELTKAGESSAEFLTLYQKLIQDSPWKQFLAIQGVLTKLADLLTHEIQDLHRLEETTLTSDLAQGYALIQLTELLASFLDNDAIKRQYKGRLVAAVLNGYLSLRRLVVQRTRLVDDTQEKLLELLEEMTTGTEEETKAFMAVCIETVDKFSPHDVLTPVFIFERLCSIIYPEENDIGEFFLTLEKDPQQEDFLQGRMLGNPYSSLEGGLGPLMRNVKNKICQDCELVALLEDDNGMELLVNNKIMSLDLPVKEVYKKVWLAEGGEGDSMKVVYRMRGLLGDATEEFIETLNAKSQETVDNEEVYKMANVLADCGGLKTMLGRLAAISSISRARSLLQVLLKLFRLCVKVRKNQEVLCQPELGAIEIFLSVLQLCLESESDASQASITEQLLDIMETILSNAASQSLEEFTAFSQTFGGPEYIRSLLTCTTSANVRNNQSVLVHLTHVLAALVYGNQEKMEILLEYFKPVLMFNKFDFKHTSEDEHKLEMFCVLTIGIERNAIGNTLKDYIISLDVVSEALEYIMMHAPSVKPTLLRTDSDELKEFISKPALKYVLRFLTGLAQGHEKTQIAVAADIIPIIHCLEQVSSDEHVGSLAENLLEALRTNESVASQIESVREFTRSEKKRLAMAMREKQLKALGMGTNDKGQLTAKSSLMQQMEELGEESGLVCCICREGYKYQPSKVLGIYTFTKRCNVEDFEAKARKTVGYNTVTHFNVVHVDCHMSAVRLARARDEWESAALQNANTKCNGLLPLWGPQVPESAFASCLARHNTYLQESTGHRDIGHQSTVHDLKLLLLRFAQEKSFHDDTGGGGPQSNLHMIPYLIHMALYVINTTRSAPREEKSLMAYIELTSTEKWIESSYDSEGPLYWLVLSVLLHSTQRWQANKLSHLRRLLVLAQTRHCHPTGPCKVLEDKQLKEYSVYRPYLIFFGIIDGLYNYSFKNVTGSDEQWPTNLADYIRHNDEAMIKASERLLNMYTEELLPCASFDEFCDVTGLLSVISNPDTYISDILKGI